MGKYASIQAGTIQKLIPLLNDQSSEVRLNALKVRLFSSDNSFNRSASVQLFDFATHSCY